MCNSIHYNSIPLKRKIGKGYKIFQKYRDTERLGTMVTGFLYKGDDKEWIEWRSRYTGDGFCIIPTKRGAERLLRIWKKAGCRGNDIIKKVLYRKGICRHIESGICSGSSHDMILAKEFRIIEE